MSDLIQVSDTVRIEKGPARRKTKATQDFYEAAKARLANLPGLGGGDVAHREPVDSAGKPIRVGQDMEYIDRDGPWGWYVYKQDEDGRYQPVGFHDAFEAAKAQAEGL